MNRITDDFFKSVSLGYKDAFEMMMKSTSDSIYFKDSQSRFLFVSDAQLRRLNEEDMQSVIGKTDFDFFSNDHAMKTFQEEQDIIRTGVPIIDKEEHAVFANGELLWSKVSRYPLYDHEQDIVGTWGISTDITKLVHAQEEVVQANTKLVALSLMDDLSGLYNRRHFDNILKNTIDLYTRRRIGGLKADFCLIYLDVDHFKEINDTYGHVKGDAVIRYLGGQLLAYTRSSDYAFRYGGDEYALILQDTDLSSGKIIGERLRRLIEQNPPVIEGTTIPLTISLGIVEFQDEKTNSELVCKADKKLYQAKSEGRNRLCG